MSRRIASFRNAPRYLWLLGLIVLAGAALRLYQLGTVPPGFQFDEAYNALDAARVQAGDWSLFFPDNGGREPLYTYWQALLFSLFGQDLFALRLASAIAGILTLPLAFGAIRYLFREHPRADALAVLTAGFLAVSFWHLHFSHYAIRAVTLPAILLATLWVFWCGQATSRRWAFVAAGVGLAAGVYTHPAGRLVPFLLIGFSLYDVAFSKRADARTVNVMGLVVAGVVSFVLFLPLGVYFLRHPWLFTGHPSDVSVFGTGVNQDDLIGTLLHHSLALAGMFLWRGDPSWLHNLPGRPVFDPISGLAFLAGLAAWAWALVRRPAWAGDRRPYVFLGAWIVVMVLPSLLSDNPPNFSRAIGALPAIYVFPALGLLTVWEWLRGMVDRGWETGDGRLGIVGWGLAALVLAASGTWTARDYYVTFAQDRDAYYWYDADKGEVAEVLKDLAAQGRVYMAPPWVKHATVAFLTQGWGIKEVALGTGVVLPDPAAGQDAYYVLRADDAGESRFVGRRLGPQAEEWTIDDRYGNLLLFVHRLPAGSIPDGVPAPEHELHASFGNLIELRGYTMDASVEAGDRLDILFYWRCLGPAPLNYTQFVHLLDENGERRAQRDREPLDTTYRTSEWQPGEVIIDRFRVNLDDGVPPGPYKLLVGWYDLDTGDRLPVAGTGETTVQITGLEVTPAEQARASETAP